VELRFSDPEYGVAVLDILDPQTAKLARAQSGCVEKDRRNPRHGRTEWRVVPRPQTTCGGQHSADLVGFHNDGAHVWPCSAEGILAWNERGRVRSTPIEAELSDDLLRFPARVGMKRCKASVPSLIVGATQVRCTRSNEVSAELA
jgi:hypothetical protein